MAIDSVGATSGAAQTQVQQKSVGQDDLFKILLTQLTYQDPLKPLDNQEFIAQLAQFSGLEQSRQINDKLDSLLSVQASNQAVDLLGRSVEVRTDSGSVVGTVAGINYDQGSPILTVKNTDGQYLNDVRLSQVFIVR